MSFGPFAGTYDPLFRGAWLKWAHGLGHVQALDADIEAFSFDGHRDPLLGVQADYDSRRHGFSVRATARAGSLALGTDAWGRRAQLPLRARSHRLGGGVPRQKAPTVLSESQQRAVQFPIADARAAFNSSLRSRLPGARRADVGVIRRRQPYHYSRRFQLRHYLTVLSALNNRDKHRTLQPIWVQPTRVDVEITRMQDCVVPRLGFPRRPTPLEVGEEFTFIRARKRGTAPRLEVTPRVTGEPSIENRIGVRTWIVQCAVFAAVMLREFSEPPPEVIDRSDLWAWFALHPAASRLPVKRS
jgi:hypothetical protein